MLVDITSDSIQYAEEIIFKLLEVGVSTIVVNLDLTDDSSFYSKSLDSLLKRRSDVILTVDTYDVNSKLYERANIGHLDFQLETLADTSAPVVNKMILSKADSLGNIRSHVAVKAAYEFTRDIDFREILRDSVTEELYFDYYSNCLGYMTTKPNEIDSILINENYSNFMRDRIVILTSLENDLKYLTPYDIIYKPQTDFISPDGGILDLSCGSEEPGMFVPYILANMINTLIKATPEQLEKLKIKD